MEVTFTVLHDPLAKNYRLAFHRSTRSELPSVPCGPASKPFESLNALKARLLEVELSESIANTGDNLQTRNNAYFVTISQLRKLGFEDWWFAG